MWKRSNRYSSHRRVTDTDYYASTGFYKRRHFGKNYCTLLSSNRYRPEALCIEKSWLLCKNCPVLCYRKLKGYALKCDNCTLRFKCLTGDFKSAR